jgi:hypothetical protein
VLILFLRLVPVLSPEGHSVRSLGKVLVFVLVLAIVLIRFLRLVPVQSPEEHPVCSLGKILVLVLARAYSVPSPGSCSVS